MLWPWCFPDQPCARCGEPVSQASAVAVFVVEMGSGREVSRWAHDDRTTCQENLA